MDDYIDPQNATHVRITSGHDGLEVDGADDQGGFTEEVWTHCGMNTDNPRPITDETADVCARDFASHVIGKPDLPIRRTA